MNNLKTLQINDTVAMSADYVRAVGSATIRGEMRKSRGSIKKIDGGMALIQWKGSDEPRWTSLAALALYYRPSNVGAL